MPTLNPMGVLDLSIVTELLIDTVNVYWPDSQLWATLFSDAFFKPNVTGLTPEAVRSLQDGNCQVTISLIHIEPSRSQRNFVYPPTPPGPHPPPPRAQKIPSLPLGLDLYYFVSAYSLNNYQQEQQAISIILNCFHQNPILRTNVTFPGSPPESTPEEYSLTMEMESVDSISRFWQATTAPFRLSVMYRVAVVFLTPPAAAVSAKQVAQFTLAASTSWFPVAEGGQVFGTSSTTTFTPPDSTPADPQTLQVNYAPATVTPGQRFHLNGAGLNQNSSYRVFLLGPPDYSIEQEVTHPWKTGDPDPLHPVQTASRIVLDVPATFVGGAPAPGVYLLRAGGDSSEIRTNSTPFSVAAQVDLPGSPAVSVLSPEAGVYSFTGMGFIAGSTELLLDTVPLTFVPLPPPGQGQFTVSGNTGIAFQPPANLKSGPYTVRVRVNGVESPPALWIKVA